MNIHRCIASISLLLFGLERSGAQQDDDVSGNAFDSGRRLSSYEKLWVYEPQSIVTDNVSAVVQTTCYC